MINNNHFWLPPIAFYHLTLLMEFNLAWLLTMGTRFHLIFHIYKLKSNFQINSTYKNISFNVNVIYKQWKSAIIEYTWMIIKPDLLLIHSKNISMVRHILYDRIWPEFWGVNRCWCRSPSMPGVTFKPWWLNKAGVSMLAACEWYLLFTGVAETGGLLENSKAYSF